MIFILILNFGSMVCQFGRNILAYMTAQEQMATNWHLIILIFWYVLIIFSSCEHHLNSNKQNYGTTIE